MSRNQKILLIIACVLYVFVIYGFFNFDLYLIVVLFALHSIALIMFAYAVYNNNGNPDEVVQLQQEIGILRAENAEAERNCEKKISEMQEEVDKAGEELKKEQQKNEELQSRLKDNESEKDKLRESANEAAALSSILPKAGDDEKAEVDIIAVAGKVADDLKDAARKARLSINISTAEKSIMVRASKWRMEILFRNIIDNSIKYMNREGTLVITISVINDDIFIVLKDSGKGLAEAETKHIFELNYQGSNRVSGNGLGLSQAKAIVDYYGGNIYARSGEGKGMGIYIQLPASVS